MRIVTLVARILLGLIFVVFGLNGFLNFIDAGPLPPEPAGQFLGALVTSHYYWVVAAVQVVGGLLMFVNRSVPIALVLLGPVIVNIICFHVFMNPTGFAPALVVTVLWLIVFYGYRRNFAGILALDPVTAPTNG